MSSAPSKPCDTFICPDGMIPQYIASYTFPVCIYGRYPATATSDGMLECRNGGRVVERECILFEEAIAPCSPTPKPQEPSMSSAPSKIAEPSRSAEPSMSSAPSKIAEPSRSAEPSKITEPSRSAEPSKIAEPSITEPSKPCDTFICPDGMIPQYIASYTFPVCIYGRYPATETSDGMECRNGGRLVERECILFEEAIVVPCSPTPKPQEPSMSATPTKPIISAKITIEIRTNMTFTNVTNTTALEDPQVVYTLRDAISKALGVPIELIVIESIQFIADGIVQTTANVQGQGQGRRLIQTGYDISYKIMDPPPNILQSVNQLAEKITASPDIASAIVNTLQSMTGITIQPESVGIQSEMSVQLPQEQAQQIQQSQAQDPSRMYFMIGGICAALGMVGVGALFLYKSRKRPVEIPDMDPVTIINPMPEPIFPTPRYFNQSVRDVVFHKPQQVRRV